MKKIAFLILVVLGTTSYAQRKAGGWAVQARYGLMEGKGQMNSFWGAFPEGQATSGAIGANVLIGNKGLMAEGNFFMNDYFVDKDNFNLPYRLYGLNILGGWSYEGFRKIYLNFKGGGFIGIENVNNGKQTENIYEILLPNSVDAFTYGMLIIPEVEIKIWNKLSGLVSFSQYWNIGSKYSHFKYDVNLGVKWYF